MFLNFPGHRMCKMRTVNVCKGKFDIFKNNKLSVLGRQLKRNKYISKICCCFYECV